MKNPAPFSRRSFVTGCTASVAAVAASMNERFALAEEAAAKAGVSGKINHSACKWCYKDISLDDLCTAGKQFGLHAIDLLDPADFATMKKHDMHCPMVSFPSAEVEIGGSKRRSARSRTPSTVSSITTRSSRSTNRSSRKARRRDLPM